LQKSDKFLAVYGTHHPVAFVTGSGSKRVGRSVALHLARRGYKLAIHCRTATSEAEALAAEIHSLGSDALCLVGQVQDESTVEEWMTKIVSRFGRLDLLVNCAAIWEPKSIESTTVDDVRFHFDTNVLGTFLCSQKAGLQMVTQSHGGCILMVGDWAIEHPYQNFSAYFVSKGSIPTLTKSLAIEFAARNPRIRVNAIAPGPILYADGVDDQTKETILQQCLLKRHGSVEDLAEGVSFLAESPFITGVVLPIDGGRTLGTSGNSDAPAHPRSASR
jgi:pteridine reductase